MCLGNGTMSLVKKSLCICCLMLLYGDDFRVCKLSSNRELDIVVDDMNNIIELTVFYGDD